ncbi:MAG: HAD family phosphatase [Eubacteriales bacterium]|nr:HAD family phosphatase [Eubacteriales bacterium]
MSHAHNRKYYVLSNCVVLWQQLRVLRISVKRGKPFTDIYLFDCRKSGLEPGECLAIEDSPNGVRSAYGAGEKVVIVPDLTGPTDELRRMCRVADRIEEVMEYLITFHTSIDPENGKLSDCKKARKCICTDFFDYY